MEYVEQADLPNDKDSKKFYLLSKHSGELPFKLVPVTILTPNGRKLVEDFKVSKGEFLGGGVMKSPDFESAAKENPRSLEIYEMMKMQISMLPSKEVLRLSTQLTSEWIAFEYSLVFSITMYGYIVGPKWDQVDLIEFKKKGFFGDSIAKITYRDRQNLTHTRKIQANNANLNSLREISSACGIPVT